MGKRVWEHMHWYTIGTLRRVYDWALKWARTKYGTHALFWVAFVESSFFPVPPDALLLCLGVAKPKRSLWYAFLATIGSTLGGLLGYLIGYVFFESLGQWVLDVFSLQSEFAIVGEYFTNNAFLAIVGAAFTPIPYKVFTIASGFWAINIPLFIAASLVGRGSRFFAEGLTLYFGGPKLAAFIDKWFSWISLGVFILLLLVLIAFGLWH